MQVSAESLIRLRKVFSDFETRRQPWEKYWQELADYIFTRRFAGVNRHTTEKGPQVHNPELMDGIAAIAARTLAYGMMNGITSPARPWFTLRAPANIDTPAVRVWLDRAREDMMFAIDQSNFYTALATQYLDLATFQSAAMLIYEDDETVFRCYNYGIGEYFFAQNNRQIIDRFGRKFSWRIEQIVAEFGIENCSEAVQRQYKENHLTQTRTICHLIEPNDNVEGARLGVPRIFPFREVYWEEPKTGDTVLRARGFHEWPGACNRWEVIGNQDYGTGPSTDALPDIRQLQHMQKRKLQALDKLISPPLIADVQLEHRTAAFLPGSVTYVAGAGAVGAKPIFQIQPPFAEIEREIQRLEGRIYSHYYNDLFRAILGLDTVRTAREIEAREAEKLVLLGPVHDRFQRETLEPAIRRIFGIMFRNGLFEPPPPELEDAILSVEYSSILGDARRALDAAPIERGVAFVGNLAGAVPQVLDLISWDDLVRDYFDKVGVSPANLAAAEQVEQLRQGRAEQEAAAQLPEAAKTAQLLSQTPVGGAASALDVVLGAGS